MKQWIVALAVVVVGLCLPATASADCTSASANQSYTNVLQFVASTHNNCGASNHLVIAWIAGWWGMPQNCSGTVTGTTCTDEETSTNAVTTVSAVTCGYGSGESLHYKDTGGGWGAVASPHNYRTVTLYSGACEPSDACIHQGPTWQWDGSNCTEQPGSPLVINLKSDKRPKMTTLGHGVWFDIDADGTLDHLSWVKDDDTAFLAIDRNGNGRIDDGSELFGNHTYADLGDGFAALARMHFEAGGLEARVDADSPLFASLLLWQDRNGDGISQAAELRPASTELAAIGLNYSWVNEKDQRGNWFVWRGWTHLRTAAGKNKPTSPLEDQARTRAVYDVYFVVED